jgi:tetratricopeptide (TPR) repeat protein
MIETLRAQRLKLRGHYELAIEECAKVLAANPANKYVWLERADIYDRLGKPSEAEGELDALIARFPSFYPGYAERAWLFVQHSPPVTALEAALNTLLRTNAATTDHVMEDLYRRGLKEACRRP